MSNLINENYISIEDAARFLNIKSVTLRKWIKDKNVPVTGVSRQQKVYEKRTQNRIYDIYPHGIQVLPQSAQHPVCHRVHVHERHEKRKQLYVSSNLVALIYNSPQLSGKAIQRPHHTDGKQEAKL